MTLNFCWNALSLSGVISCLWKYGNHTFDEHSKMLRYSFVRTLHMCTAGEQADFAEEDDDEPVIRIHRKASYYLLLLLAQLFTT